MDDWIRATERLPEKSGRYLTYREYENGNRKITREIMTDVFYINAECWSEDFNYGGEVTHWMELPEPPKEG